MVKYEEHNRFSTLVVAASYLRNVIYMLVATAIDFIYIHCLQVAITTPEGASLGYPNIKISSYR